MKKLMLIFIGSILLGACFKPSPKITLDEDWIVYKIDLSDNCDPMSALVGLAFINDSIFSFQHQFLHFGDEILGFCMDDTLYYIDGDKAVVRLKGDSLILDGDIIYSLYKKK
ncbi:MAG: hypothetical protein J5701_00505 [Bacteroidales bacterium]|nr:hypothetical protein [Bacteroidales bacterium]